MIYGPKETQRKARVLRSEMSLPEVLLWRVLRQHPGGMKFRRQHPAGRYVLNFFCASLGLAIEVDGEGHGRANRPERDAARDTWLSSQGVTVCRVQAAAVLADLDAVVTHIVDVASAAPPLHHASHGPPPPAGEDL